MLEEKDFVYQTCIAIYDSDLLELIAYYMLDDEDTSETDFYDAVDEFMQDYYDTYGNALPQEVKEYVCERVKQLIQEI